MGTVTPNIGIYIPADGETNYGTAFANGMNNLDAHDHSGAPNKGVPLSSSALAAGSVTRDKLNSNVLSPGGGLSFDINNAIQTDGVLLAIYGLGSNGLIARTSSTTSAARTIQGTTNIIDVTNGNGTLGNPTINLSSNFYAENVWVPQIAGSTIAGSPTYTVQIGLYQRVGNWVEVYGYVAFSNIGGATGNLQIANLPFIANNFAQNYMMGQLDLAANTLSSAPAGSTYPFVRARPNETKLDVLVYNPTTGANDTIDITTVSLPDDYAFKIRYLIAS